jgi:hypothetical protein
MFVWQEAALHGKAASQFKLCVRVASLCD